MCTRTGGFTMIELTDKTFKDAISTKDVPVLVDFYASWCGPCNMLSPVLDELSKDPDFKGKVTFAKVSTEDYPEYAQQFSVQGIPCLILAKNGKEVSRIVGFAPKPVMKAKIQSILKEA